jgi:hypothetical protein
MGFTWHGLRAPSLVTFRAILILPSDEWVSLGTLGHIGDSVVF